MNFVEDHLARVEQALLRGYSLTKVPEWICDNTYLKGDHYSYEDHEFQEVIARDLAFEVNVRKCSQIGLSELSARIALAFCNTMPGFTTIYTMPTAHDAKKFAKSRIDPIIASSPALRKAINPDMDSGEMKQFGESFLHIKGTKGQTAAISVPADALMHDELDFSDEEVVSNYESRLTHSKHKLKRKFSTPTVGGRGISHEMDTSKRHWNFVKCCHCNEQFVPDYFKHVRIPGYTGSIKEITKDNLWHYRWREAYVECPKCGKEPDLGPANRQWVVENTDYTGDKHGYQVQPFDAPKIVTPGDLVKMSTKYKRYADFINFGLGLPAEDAETSFSEEELLALFLPRPSNQCFQPYAYVMGIDVGIYCHVMVAGVGVDGKLDVVHAQRIHFSKLEELKTDLMIRFRIRVTVMDSQPYYDLLTRLQAKDMNLWGAVFSQKKGIEMMKATDKEKDAETGQEKVREAALGRNRVLDKVMGFVRQGGLAYRGQPLESKDEIVLHMKDLKRVKELDQHDEEVFVWKKSVNGDDHYHFTLLYTYIASLLLGTVTSSIILPFGLTTIKLKDQVDERGRSQGRSL